MRGGFCSIRSCLRGRVADFDFRGPAWLTEQKAESFLLVIAIQ
jgi:hypothetical protein